jgi:hypothetical protein
MHLGKADWSKQDALEFKGTVGDILGEPNSDIDSERYVCIEVSKQFAHLGLHESVMPQRAGEDVTVVARQSVFLSESRAYGHDCSARGIRYLTGKNSISRPRL